MMDDSAVSLFIKNSYARMRRSADGENFLIGLPGFFYDFFRLSLQYRFGPFGAAASLPMSYTIGGSNDLAVVPLTSYRPPSFETVGLDLNMGVPFKPYINVNGTAFNNNLQFEFAPSITSGLDADHPYNLFNVLIHRAIIQPGILLMPAFFNSQSSSTSERSYGPLLVTEAKITGSEGGGLSISVSMQGSTCVSVTWDTNSATQELLKTPSRSAGLADTVVLIGSDADIYFDRNNLFRESLFESNYEDPDSLMYTQLNVSSDKKRVVSWEISIINEYEFTRTMPSNNWVGYGANQMTSYFKSNDSAGVRYAVLKDRKVSGKITFLSDRIQDFDDDYLRDNDNSNNIETRRLIVSIAPGFHFPLTDVQFSIGNPEYTPEKAVRTDYKFVARVPKNIAMSLMGNAYSNPTSEFGYTYNLNNNELTGASS